MTGIDVKSAVLVASRRYALIPKITEDNHSEEAAAYSEYFAGAQFAYAA